MYIQKGDGFIMVYSVSSAQSIDRVDELYKQISRLNEDKNVIFITPKICQKLIIYFFNFDI